MTNILLILNMNTFYCHWFKRDITKKKPESLRFDWSVSAHRVSRYAGRDVTLGFYVMREQVDWNWVGKLLRPFQYGPQRLIVMKTYDLLHGQRPRLEIDRSVGEITSSLFVEF